MSSVSLRSVVCLIDRFPALTDVNLEVSEGEVEDDDAVLAAVERDDDLVRLVSLETLLDGRQRVANSLHKAGI